MRSDVRSLAFVGAVSLAAVAAIAFLDINRVAQFERYFGALNPVFVATFTTAAGVFALWYLHRHHGYAISPRFGFVEMLAMRMVYYLWWHVVWGEIRVGILFT